MMPTTDQLITWFFTVAEAFQMQAPGAEVEYRANLSKLNSKERSGLGAGMRQGVNDLLTMSKMCEPETIERAEAALKTKNLPSLVQMLTALKGKQVRILKRGHIENDEEFYIVAELLSNLESGITDEQRIKLDGISMAYEQSKKRT